MDLYQYFIANTGRNILKNPHYFPIYERHLARYKGHPVTMFEIGTGNGGSCLMWKAYLGPDCRIVTIDIREKPQIEEEQIFFRRGDQSDAVFLKSLLSEFGAPDIVLDDGSHQMPHIIASFEVLSRSMRRGTYLVEDLDGAYWTSRGGGLRQPGSFIEKSKSLIDEMNALYTEEGLKPDLGAELSSICFYPMMVVFEKSPHQNRHMLQMPDYLGPTRPQFGQSKS